MNIPLTEAALRLALNAIGAGAIGGAIEYFAAEDLVGEAALARLRITGAEYAAPDELVLECAPAVGLVRGNVGWFRCTGADGAQLLAHQAGRQGSGAALELNRLGVDVGAPVRLLSIRLRWPQV